MIDRHQNPNEHPQVIDLSSTHHKLHAACAFYRSGFDRAAAVVVDGAGTFIPMNINGENEMTWELESMFNCEYPSEFKTVYKHQGGRGPWGSVRFEEFSSEREGEEGTHEMILDESAGITKAYEAVTQYCGWAPIELVRLWVYSHMENQMMIFQMYIPIIMALQNGKHPIETLLYQPILTVP